jgi:hypothetical protein
MAWMSPQSDWNNTAILKRVVVNEEEELRVEREIEKIQQELEKYRLKKKEKSEQSLLPHFSFPPERPGYAYVVIAQCIER